MIFLILFMGQSLFANSNCIYSYDHDSSFLQWTAYKYTKRAGVKGHFKRIKVDTKDAKSIHEILKNTTFEIDTNSVDAGDPARNTNVLEFFFKKAISDGKLKGQVLSVTGKDKGTIEVKFIFDGKVLNVPFEYTLDKKNRFVAKAEIDVLGFGWKSALSSLHEACKEHHKDDDGESKTWSDVSLYVTTVFEKECKDEDSNFM